MPFSTVFQLFRGGQCTYPRFPGVFITNAPHTVLSKLPAPFPHNPCRKKKIDISERGMNPVAMTIINPLKAYWPSRGSNQPPRVLKFCTLFSYEASLTLSQKTNFRLFQTERVCRRQFQI